jgi:putative addiction module antidote
VFLEVKVRKIGDSIGVVLPKEAVAHLQVQEGDLICMTELPDGSLRLTSAGGQLGHQVKTAQDLVRRYQNVLRDIDG